MEANESIQIPERSPSNFLRLKYVAISVLILIVGFAGGIYYSRNVLEAPNKESAQNTPIPTSAISPEVISPQAVSQTPETDEMAGWKTYVNEEYKFSFSYPPNMNLVTDQNSWEGIGLLLQLGDNIKITVRDPKIQKEDILRNWVNYQNVRVGNMDAYLETSTSSSIGGNSPYLKRYEYLIDMPILTVFIAFNENQEDDFDKNRPIFDQILSTFEFIDF